MKKVLFSAIAIVASVEILIAQPKTDYQYRDVNFTDVHFTDKFWAPRIETLRTVTIPYAFKKCEETGRIDNFAIAAGLKSGKFNTRYPFDDSDAFKIIEGASYLLAVKKDAKLDHYIDSLIYLFSKAQEPDGYLYTTRTIGKNVHPWAGKERWSRERDNSHELYNMGHMYEAAVAHFQATGKRNFLDIAIKNANLIDSIFGVGKREVAPGHEVIEMGLVRLYRVTGDIRYLNLSQFFLNARGKYTGYDKTSEDKLKNGSYWQDHLPVTQQFEAVGHAVRAMYMFSGMTDIATLKDDPAFLNAIDKLWDNVVSKKFYITGGIGATSHGEAFGANYELPNKTAYCETCAAIANCMWNLRMFMLKGDSKYIDVLERSLYNGVLSGIDFSGNKFFYPNPQEVGKGGQERSLWFDCSCCPSNLARFIPSIPGYVYGVSNNSIYINLFASNTAQVKLDAKRIVQLRQETDYPWSGKVNIFVQPSQSGKFAVRVRIPGWAENTPVPSDLFTYTDKTQAKTTIRINGKATAYSKEKGYAVLNREWKSGDHIEINFPMEVKEVLANAKVDANKGQLSFEQGPIVYCAEFKDNGSPLSNLLVSQRAKVKSEYSTDLFGINKLKVEGQQFSLNPERKIVRNPQIITLIPYYARSHRGQGEMRVYLPYAPEIPTGLLLAESLIIDQVFIANTASEKAHNLKGEKTNSGSENSWRDASDLGWFSYQVKVTDKDPVELVLTYNSLDGGNREFDIFADDVKIGFQKLRTETFSAMIDRSYRIPAEVVKGKKEVTIRIQSVPGNIAGGIYGLRIQKVSK